MIGDGEIEKMTPPEHCETGGPNPARTKAELLAYLRDTGGVARVGPLRAARHLPADERDRATRQQAVARPMSWVTGVDHGLI